LNLRLPLPPLSAQQSLGTAMSVVRAEAACERAAAEKLAAASAAALEFALLGMPVPEST